MSTGTQLRLGAHSSPTAFMYHSVSPSSAPDPYKLRVHPDRLDLHLRTLRRLGLQPVPMRELVASARAGRADRLVGLTFDDGYADFVEHAMPVLARHRVRATLYVVAGALSGSNDWDDAPQVPLVSAAQVTEVAAAGHEIGSHAMQHRRLAGHGRETVAEDATRSRQVLEELTGAPVSGFCYPYGSWDAEAAAGVQDAGYDHAVVTDDYCTQGVFSLPRSHAGQADGPARLAAKLVRHRLRTALGGWAS